MATVPFIDDSRGVSGVRVLVVEDFAPFRQFICAMLRKNPGLQVVGEASDGLDGVHKTAELRPDLILLDIGLPTLNGIAAARQICRFSAESKIVFVTQESDAAIVQGAFSLGAWGYVLKTSAAIDLLPAVEAVLEGRHFVSAGLSTGAIPRPATTVNFACVICNRPVSLEISKTNEHGQALHRECYAATIAVKTAALKDAAV